MADCVTGSLVFGRPRAEKAWFSATCASAGGRGRLGPPGAAAGVDWPLSCGDYRRWQPVRERVCSSRKRPAPEQRKQQPQRSPRTLHSAWTGARVQGRCLHDARFQAGALRCASARATSPSSSVSSCSWLVSAISSFSLCFCPSSLCAPPSDVSPWCKRSATACDQHLPCPAQPRPYGAHGTPAIAAASSYESAFSSQSTTTSR